MGVRNSLSNLTCAPNLVYFRICLRKWDAPTVPRVEIPDEIWRKNRTLSHRWLDTPRKRTNLQSCLERFTAKSRESYEFPSLCSQRVGGLVRTRSGGVCGAQATPLWGKARAENHPLAVAIVSKLASHSRCTHLLSEPEGVDDRKYVTGWGG